MAAKNRPLPPSAIYIGQQYDSTLNAYDWAATSHSLNVSNKNSTGLAQWREVLDTGAGQPGCLQFLFVAVKNTSTTKNFGAQVLIDGSYVYNNNTLTLGTTQTGIALAGRVLFTGPSIAKGVVMDELFFDSRLQILVWVDDPGISTRTMTKYYLS